MKPVLSCSGSISGAQHLKVYSGGVSIAKSLGQGECVRPDIINLHTRIGCMMQLDREANDTNDSFFALYARWAIAEKL